MRVEAVQDDVLALSADVLICPANCFLNMSGGVNGEILLRGGETIQRQLHDILKRERLRTVSPGTVVCTLAGPLSFQHILHAVAIDPFYGSSVQLVTATLRTAFEQARELAAKTIALPALATGYGPLTVEQFCAALRDAAGEDWSPVELATLVLRRPEDVALARTHFLR